MEDKGIHKADIGDRKRDAEPVAASIDEEEEFSCCCCPGAEQCRLPTNEWTDD